MFPGRTTHDGCCSSGGVTSNAGGVCRCDGRLSSSGMARLLEYNRVQGGVWYAIKGELTMGVAAGLLGTVELLAGVTLGCRAMEELGC